MMTSTGEIDTSTSRSSTGFFDSLKRNPTFVSGFYIFIWYIPNILTLLLNKYIFANLGFTFPFTLTAIHMLVCFIGAFLVLRVFKFFPLQRFEQQSQILTRVLPLSVIFCANIVLGNVSLRWVPISFMQTIKSSVPAFAVFLQAFLFGDTKGLTALKIASLIPIVGGVGLASWTEVNFEMTGFVTALVASVMTALQAMLSGRLLTQKLDSVNLVYYMAPLSFMFLLPFAYVYEFSGIVNLWEHNTDLYAYSILFLSGAIAFALNVTSFLVIVNTSPLTFTVSGNLKVVFSIGISVLVFQNQVTMWNFIGCATAIVGVAWYQKICMDISAEEKKTMPK